MSGPTGAKPTFAQTVSRSIRVESFGTSHAADALPTTRISCAIRGMTAAEAMDFIQGFTEFVENSVRSYEAVEKYGPSKKDS